MSRKTRAVVTAVAAGAAVAASVATAGAASAATSSPAAATPQRHAGELMTYTGGTVWNGSYTVDVNGHLAKQVVSAGSKSAKLVTITLPSVADGASVTVTGAYEVSGHNTKPVLLGSFKVICPATVALSVKCSCDITLSASNPFSAASGYAEQIDYTANGQAHTVPVPAGGSKSVAVTITNGGSVTYRAVVLHNGTEVATTKTATYTS